MIEYIIVIAIWLGIAVLGAKMADSRNRSVAAGFLLCLFTGVIGLLIIALMGEKMVAYHYKGELSPVEPPEKEDNKKPWEV